MIRGHNNDLLHVHSGDHQVEFFSKAGSLMQKGKRGKRGKRGKGPSFYGDGTETTALSLFQPMWMMPGLDNKTVAMQLLFWLRDPRGGAGNRSGFRECLRWLVQQPAMTGEESGAAWLAVNAMRVPEWGRWDDLAELFGTELESLVAGIWTEAIMRKDHLACKWAKVDMVPLQRMLKINERGLRQLIVPPRSTVVERAMCARDWQGFDYSHIPSKAMSMYTKAFRVHDKERFDAYKAALARGDQDVKVNASVLFPHDCMKQARYGDPAIAEAQFRALSDFIGGTDRRIMCLCDTSGSMIAPVMDKVTNNMVARSLAMYCSDRLGEGNVFYRRYMEFSTVPIWVDWRNESFVQAQNGQGAGYVGSTNVEAALDIMLKSAEAAKLPPDEMITMLLIISDMQFDQACQGSHSAVEECMRRWEAAGYKRPTIVYWNLAGYAGQPEKATTPNTAMVSGFSPAILKSVLSGKEVSPREVMLRAISKYQVEIPLVGEANT